MLMAHIFLAKRVLTSNNNELAVRAFETGCRCWVQVPGAGAGCGAGCGAGAGCCELAVRVVEAAGELRGS